MRLAAPDHWPTLGWEAIDWIEAYLVHGPGDIQDTPIVLDDEWCEVLLDLYRLYPPGHELAGRRVVRRGVLSRAKGRAKSELAGMVASFEALGPCRFDGWNADGEPVGRPVRAPFVRCLATEEEQSGNTYDNVRVMLTHIADHFGDEYPGIDVGITRTFLAGGGEIVPSTSGSSSKDGGKETFAVADETHLYVLAELKRMHAMVRRNLGKRKLGEPWMLDTTTMYAPGEHSIAEEAHDHAIKVAAGKAKDVGLYYNHREAPPVANWDDDDELRAALAAGYGEAAGWMDLESIIRDMRDPSASQADSRRYWLNQPAKGEKAGIDPLRWKDVEVPRAVEDGTRVGLGFDGSISDDATALLACTADGYLFPIRVWVRPERASKGWRIPRLEVRDAVHETFERFDVGLMLCDPAKWHTEIEEWAAEFGDERVLAFDTNTTRRMAAACDRFATGVTEGSRTHSGDSLVTAHVLAMARKKVRIRDDDDDGRTKFVFVKSDTRKIDAGIAAVLASEAAATMPEVAATTEPFMVVT